uniref:Protein translocase subunit SecF n=1 Tax=Streptomyces galbus TaxID=33898 RepID=Q8KLQ1_STRGB|nr:protein-export membrane protein SecF [Streptomyces galbus]
MSKLGNLGARLHRGEIWYGVSILITITAILGLAVRGLNMGIEFQGGAVFTTPTKMSTSVAKAGGVRQRGLRHQAVVQELGNGSLRIQIAGFDTAQSDKIKQELAKDLNLDPEKLAADLVGPSWGEQIASKAWQGLAISMVLVVIYLAIAFECVHGRRALVALIHDITITTGIYPWSFEVTPGTVIGLLTILGYSLYDTVVVFDSLKEQTRDITKQTRFTYTDIANRSINGTLVRSINTTVVALLPVAGLLFIGGGFLGYDISLSLFVLAAGAYSSIFIATPLLPTSRSASRPSRRSGSGSWPTEPRPPPRRASASPVPPPDDADDTDDAAPAVVGPRNQPGPAAGPRPTSGKRR